MPEKIKNSVFNDENSGSPIGKRVLTLLVLLYSLFILPQTAFAAWTSYTDSGFLAPTVIYNKYNQTDCSAAGCSGTYACPTSANPNQLCPLIQQPDPNGIHEEVVCPNLNANYPEFGLLRRIMPCVKETLLVAADNFLSGGIISYMADVVAAASTLAVALLGVKMFAGTTSITWKDSMILAAKLGGVAYFSSHLIAPQPPSAHPPFALFPTALDIMDDLVGRVMGYALTGTAFEFAPDCVGWVGTQDMNIDTSNHIIITSANAIWDFMDCTFEMLIGGIVGGISGSTISNGILAFLLACVVSKGMGITIGLIGFYFIIQMLTAVVRCLYIFITGYMGVAFCMLIAPIFIPTLLLTATSKYFFYWLKALGGFMLQPVVVAAYLGMLLTAFNVVVFAGQYSISAAIVGNGTLTGTNANGDFIQNGGIGGWALSQQYSDQTGSMQTTCLSPAMVSYCTNQTIPILRQSCMNETPAALCGQDTACINSITSVVTYCLNQSDSDLRDDCRNATPCVYSEQSIGATGVVMNAGTITNAKINGNANNTPAFQARPDPQNTQQYGVGGAMPTTKQIKTVNSSFFDTVGITSSTSSVQLLGVDVPIHPVNWDFLSQNNFQQTGNQNYDPSGAGGQQQATNNYLLDVLQATLMAFLVGYIFLQLLDVIPFLGSGLSGSDQTNALMNAKSILGKGPAGK